MPDALLVAVLLAATGPSVPAAPGASAPPAAPVVEDTHAPAPPEAQAPAAPAAPVPEPPKASAATPAPGPAADAPPTRAQTASALGRAEAASHSGNAAGPLPPSLTSRSLAEELRRRGKDRDAQQEAIEAERKRLEVLRDEIARARAALKDETARLQELVAAVGASGQGSRPVKKGPGGKPIPEQDGIGTLAQTFKGMKPDQAAAVMAKLDRGLAAAVLGRMRPADAALVVEKMDAGTGAELMALLAGRNRS
ncbi:MAG: hypothetical protein QM767_14915 [Anaeromyxobacter sp.]